MKTKAWKRLKCEDLHVTNSCLCSADTSLSVSDQKELENVCRNNAVDTAKRMKHNFNISLARSFVQKPGSRPERKLDRKKLDNTTAIAQEKDGDAAY